MLNERVQTAWWQAGVWPRNVADARRGDIHGDVRVLLSRLYPVAKRCLDLAVAIVALLLLAPLMSVIAVLILLDSAGPVFVVQKRSGLGGRTFQFYKFRSMTDSHDHTQEHRRFAEAYINGHTPSAAQNSAGQLIYKPASNGHTVTRMGRWLRRTSLDELPQLFNVLKGDMSLVGPRPTMEYETSYYTERHRQRLAALPGMTGWAQIHGRSSLLFDDIATLDIEYIARRSFLFDLRILLATIPIVLRAEHAG